MLLISHTPHHLTDKEQEAQPRWRSVPTHTVAELPAPVDVSRRGHASVLLMTVGVTDACGTMLV